MISSSALALRSLLFGAGLASAACTRSAPVAHADAYVPRLRSLTVTTVPLLAVSLPGNKTTEATYVAKRAGIFPIVCAIQAHLPMMSGQLVVLPSATMQTPSAAP